MRRLSSLILSAALLAAAVSPASAIGQSGKPRVLVKAFLLKTDKTFDHATSWCDHDTICTLTVGDYDVGLRFFATGFTIDSSYRLRVAASRENAEPCCFFEDGHYETSVASGLPHAETLYYRTTSGLQALGTFYIALEGLK